jgi:uncharacterized protein
MASLRRNQLRLSQVAKHPVGSTMGLTLIARPEQFAICRLEPGSHFPAWAMAGAFRSATWTPEELSIVCEEARVPQDVKAERGWRALKVDGPLDFALTGILLAIAEPLARAEISLFAVSTFDTDYVLVKSDSFPQACRALSDYGHSIR